MDGPDQTECLIIYELFVICVKYDDCNIVFLRKTAFDGHFCATFNFTWTENKILSVNAKSIFCPLMSVRGILWNYDD